LRRAFGEAGRARALEYTWEKVAARRYELVRSALSGGARAPGSNPCQPTLFMGCHDKRKAS
jgi:hypothetical protein